MLDLYLLCLLNLDKSSLNLLNLEFFIDDPEEVLPIRAQVQLNLFDQAHALSLLVVHLRLRLTRVFIIIGHHVIVDQLRLLIHDVLGKRLHTQVFEFNQLEHLGRLHQHLVVQGFLGFLLALGLGECEQFYELRADYCRVVVQLVPC